MYCQFIELPVRRLLRRTEALTFSKVRNRDSVLEMLWMSEYNYCCERKFIADGKLTYKRTVIRM